MLNFSEVNETGWAAWPLTLHEIYNEMKYIMTFKLGYEIEFQDYLKSLPTDVYMQKPEVVGWRVAGEQPTIVESKYFKVEEPLKV